MSKKKGAQDEDNINKAHVEFEMCIETHKQLTAEEMEEIKSYIKHQTFEKGAIVLREGEYSDKCFNVFKGSVRQYYIVDGEEKTTFLYSEGQTIFAPTNEDTPGPSKYYLECIEETTLSITSPEAERLIFKKIPKLEPISRAAMVAELSKYQEMFARHIMSSAEQRYLDLLENRPELLNKVPHYQLASYLGVKPESLSRIRKRIMQKQI